MNRNQGIARWSMVAGLALWAGILPAVAQDYTSDAPEPDTAKTEDTGAVAAEFAVETHRGDGPPPRGQMGFISVKTVPSKATVYLAGSEIGDTPVEAKSVPSGRHTLTIMLQGEELLKDRVNIWPNQTTIIDRNLVMPYGSLYLTTKPSKTVVHIDGQEVARTTGGPLTINNIEAGSHILKVTALGYRGKELEIEIRGEDTTSVNVSLGR